MELLNKVKKVLEQDKRYDFSSEFWTGEMLSVIYDAVYATEQILRTNEDLIKAYRLGSEDASGFTNEISIEDLTQRINDAKPIHRLRGMVRDLSENITDEELDYLETKLPIGQYLNYEYSGNFIITKDVIKRDAAVENMCCGIITKDVEMPINNWLYFAFDYGH